MANTKVWCLLINLAKEPDGAPFEVEVSSTDTVGHLKKKVKLKNKAELDSFPVHHLVDYSTSTDFSRCLDIKASSSMKRKHEGDDMLWSFEKEQNKDVERDITGRVFPREDTVAAIWERLREYCFVWARGTPASGNTALSNLLAAHAKSHLAS
ncbi:hypothetical protein EI94DRAFT_1806107 [Lactarius quietus]|nr:hypothetical protein EI94DRAFT_1806107 [Lactarius quietus]